MDLGKLTVAVITMSDSRVANSDKVDLSGELIQTMVKEAGYHVGSYQLIGDEFDLIKEALLTTSDAGFSLILTTGGTGLSPRDNTPEATKAVIEKEVPGISEAMRYASMQLTPRAMLSRGVSGIRKQSLIINLPGSPKAVKENLACILPTLRHGLEVLRQEVTECGTESSK